MGKREGGGGGWAMAQRARFAPPADFLVAPSEIMVRLD